ncbi:CE1759 family FMN reductase [Boudabousia marimammalium]|uniref:NADPH-dependent FMN reductase-like domain-containing protein n=1 Tax=Boudabousia marimammalium TaxID=156892 RepID=A0A1Q5PSM5_9ACTO|nr:CE1759 family FMN reductase [Boudabousia marimammalium]OKL50442.1 hypothetical protein BM477_00235 [Boudabousia marimammalium]
MTTETSTKTVRLTVLSAGLSIPSSTRVLADALTNAVVARVKASGAKVEITNVELRDIALDVARVMVTGMPVQSVEDALDALEAADAVIAVSPVFAGSYSGVFKSFMDLVGTQRLMGTPVLLGATGGSLRHSLVLDHAMRPLFSAMRAQTAGTAVFAAAEDFGASSQMQPRVERAADDLFRMLALTADGSVPEVAASEKPASAGAAPAIPAAPRVANTPGVAAGPGASGASAGPIHKSTIPRNQRPKQDVGKPGKAALAALLKRDGTAGRLRPDVDDFMPMAELLGETSK